jgi:hypothetical protein
MERRTRRILLITAGAVAVWYLVVALAWAVRPLSDSIPIGTDYTLKQPHLVSQKVACNSLFDDTASDGLLLTLKPQPKGFPPLGYQRSACTIVQRDARIVFGLDSLGAFVVIGGLLYLALRRQRHPAGSHRDPAPSYA